jgi:hypothetical protein
LIYGKIFLDDKENSLMAIKIGNNNKIKNSNIVQGNDIDVNLNSKDTTKMSFSNRHPIIMGIITSIISSIILMIPFWDKVSDFIKGLF